MGKVTITVYGALREKLRWKRREVIFDGDKITFKELLEVEPELKFVISQGNTDAVRDFIILLNGIHLQFKGGFNAIVRDGDEISIFPPGGGG